MDVTRLAGAVSKAAMRALAAADDMAMTELCLRLYRDDTQKSWPSPSSVLS